MESKTQKGYLLLADISGYTSFLARTELEHANIALSYLLEEIVMQLGGELTIVKLEGDAVLAYVEEEQLPRAEALLALIDQTYRAFRRKAELLHEGTTCNCRACEELPTLDLKFMVHIGNFIVQQIAGIRELLGSDVNLVHRLMKNSVEEATGWRGYALFTPQVLEGLQADPEMFLRQLESYEHYGEVETYVMDMHARYASPEEG